MGEELSQDDIDALLGGGGDTGGADDAASAGDTGDAGADAGGFESVGGEAQPTVADQLLELADSAMAVGAKAWQTMINKQVTWTRNGAQVADPFGVLATCQGEFVAASVGVTGQIPGAVAFLVPKTTAVYAISAMLMEDEAAFNERNGNPFGEEEIDAFQEEINVACGSIGQAWRDALGTDTSFDQCTIKSAELPGGAADLGLPDGVCAVMPVTFNLEGLDDSDGFMIFDPALYDAWGKKAAPEAELATDTGMDMSATASDACTDSGEGPIEGTMESALDRVLSLEIPVRVIIANKRMTISGAQEISPGTIIEFDKNCEEILDIYVNNQIIGRGEVVIKRERFGIQVKNILNLEERIRMLQ